MINILDLTLSYGEQVLFKEVNIKFLPGNCYGVIGANGAGKSTFLKIMAGEIDPTSGEIVVGNDQRLAMLRQDQNAFDDYTVLDTVIYGYPKLYQLLKERDELYAKEDFTEEDGLKAAEIEGDLAELDGYSAENEAAYLLTELGIEETFHQSNMKELEGRQKVRVLLAQALFGKPDILLLDEPTNNLDIKAISWLEDFLYNYDKLVIVVSHDRHFLNKVCTHIADIDFSQIKLYVGNYDFWYEASQLISKKLKDQSKKREEKIEELKKFVQRFSANAAKSKQATSRKKLIEKLTIDQLPNSSRRNPHISFKPERECGNIILNVEDLNYQFEDQVLIKNMNISVRNGDKIALIGNNHLAKTSFFDIITEQIKPNSGTFQWGQTIQRAYYPKENSSFFQDDVSILEWLKSFSPNAEETFVRGFLGQMLFKQDETLKSVQVLSGGEKVRCMLSKMMLAQANVLLFDEPTNHLDLESITALNNALIQFPEVIIFASHDHQFVNTVANRIIEFTPGGIIDRMTTFDEYLANPEVNKMRDKLYAGHFELTL
ncbi:MAG: ATP-binding cassette domain-containing protein [Spirochaetes bacterium]|nr:ATP-binding cassette domain-containing protein [Spirochaetota bacterium]